MNAVTKIAALSPVALGAVGLTQMHYVISHFTTIAEIAGVVTVGAGVWAGKSILGKGKATSVDEKVAELAAQLQAQVQPQALPRPAQVIDYTNAAQSVAKRI